MWKLAVLAVILMVASGCAAEADDRGAQFEAGSARCNASIPRAPGKFVERAECINSVAVALGYTGADENLIGAERVRLAEMADARQITPGQYDSAVARMIYEANQARAAGRSADMQQYMQSLEMILRSAQPPPVYVPDFPHTYRCNRMGVWVTCTGN